MPNPFFSGRVPQDLYDRIEDRIKATGEGKTQFLIAALSQYLGYKLPESNINISNLEIVEIKERLASLENMVGELSRTKDDNKVITKSDIPPVINVDNAVITKPNDNSDNKIISAKKSNQPCLIIS